jgi:hypothetical protein
MTPTERLAYMRHAISQGGTVLHDKRLIQLESDLPSLSELISTNGSNGSAALGYEQTFYDPLSCWTVNHNLGRYPMIVVLSLGGSEIDAEITHTSRNQLTAQFASPQAGLIRCI